MHACMYRPWLRNRHLNSQLLIHRACQPNATTLPLWADISSSESAFCEVSISSGFIVHSGGFSLFFPWQNLVYSSKVASTADSGIQFLAADSWPHVACLASVLLRAGSGQISALGSLLTTYRHTPRV